MSDTVDSSPAGAKNNSLPPLAEGYRMTELGPLPQEWQVVRLGEIANVKYGKAKPENEGNIPVIGSGGVYGWAAEPAVDFPTLIIGRKGAAGQVWLSESPCWPSDTTFYLEWKSANVVNVKFLHGWFLLKPLSGEHAKTTIPSLQRPDLENFPIPLPPICVNLILDNLAILWYYPLLRVQILARAEIKARAGRDRRIT